LSHNGVKSIYEDREGTLWISTIGGGANRLDRNKKQFVLHRNNPANPDSLISNDVRAIGEDHTGAVWIGTMDGLDRFDRQVDPGSAPAQFTHYRSDPSNPNSLSHNSVLSIVEDQLGMMWFGTLARGLDRFDHQTGQFIHYQNDPDDSQSLSHNIVRSLYVDSEDTLWVGTFGGGLNRYDSQTEKFIRYQNDPNDPSTLSDNTVMAILEDNFRELWIGTLGGLNRFDRGTGEFVRYNHDPNDQNSLSHDNAVSLFEDQAGVLWIGTNGGGLGITEDDQGYLWLSTSQGLSKFDPHLETFRNYDTYDGLQGNQFNFNSLHKSGSGELFFGGVNGFNSFYPANIQNNAYVPPVVITDFQLANKPVDIGPDSVLQKSILETDKLALSYEDQVISFEFAALNYMSPEKNRYRYTLEGFDEEWTEVGSDRRFVTYTNLNPGEYVFRVIGSNNDGIWNEEGASINITIIPPWWDTAWFRGLALLLLVGLIFGTYRWRVRNVETRSQELEAQVVEKTYELNERVKELNCLYGISRLAGRQGISLEEILQGTLGFITPSFQFPEVACARIILDDQEFKTGNFEETTLLQTANILVRGKQSGSVEVRYLSGVPESYEGLYLEEERDLISAIAGRLGRIIERKQAEEALSQRVEELAMLNQIAHTLANVTELQTALHTVVETITKIFDCAITNVSVLEDDHMKILAQYEREPGGVDMVGKTQPLLNIPGIRQVLESGESRVISDVQAISSPLAMDTVLRPGRDYSSAEVGLTEIIAVDIAGAIENARLYDQAQETAVDSERQRLARELHDSVTQSLYTTSLIAETLPGVWERHPEEALRSLEDLRQISKGALAEMRTLLLELRPGELAELKLDELLGQLTVAVSARTNLPVTISVVGNCDPPLDVQIAFYRIAQEALNNISKHAHAKRAWVNLHCSAEGINLRVRDDGRGFDPDIQKPDQLGLSIMRERAQSIGAVLSFESQPDIGTEVSVKWVVPKKEQVDE
jgi:signal transduction histidine kinase/streptogramin lyase